MGLVGQDAGRSRSRDSDQIRFVAGATADDVAELTGVRRGAAPALADSYEALLADPKVEAVVLATPHSQHAAQVIAAAQAGKHVFCEKPFALTKAEAEQAVAATSRPA